MHIFSYFGQTLGSLLSKNYFINAQFEKTLINSLGIHNAIVDLLVYPKFKNTNFIHFIKVLIFAMLKNQQIYIFYKHT